MWLGRSDHNAKPGCGTGLAETWRARGRNHNPSRMQALNRRPPPRHRGAIFGERAGNLARGSAAFRPPIKWSAGTAASVAQLPA